MNDNYILCPRCNGHGKIHDRLGGVVTLGLITFFELIDPETFKDKCPRCSGKGFIKIK